MNDSHTNKHHISKCHGNDWRFAFHKKTTYKALATETVYTKKQIIVSNKIIILKGKITAKHKSALLVSPSSNRQFSNESPKVVSSRETKYFLLGKGKRLAQACHWSDKFRACAARVLKRSSCPSSSMFRV